MDSPDDDTVRVRYNWSSTTPSAAVVETIAVALDKDPVEMNPLYDYIDPDALDELVEASSSDPTGRDTSVSFVVDGNRVTVSGSGEVAVRTATRS
jgi:hypothetical protein